MESMSGKLLTWQCLGVCLLTISLSCTDKPSKAPGPESKIIIDEQLMKISSHAAVMQMMLSVETLTRCLLADSFRTVQGREPATSDEMGKRMTTELTTLCDLLSRAERETKPTYEQIKQQGRLLDQQYFFSIYLPGGDSDDTFRENDIGLFGTIEACNQIEQEAFRQGIPVKLCRSLTI